MSSRKHTPLVIVFFIMALLLSCKGNSTKEKQVLEASAVEISIKGMTCTGCEQTIQASISKLEGVQSVKANFTEGKALVVYLPGKTDTTNMRQAITEKGYTVNRCIAVSASEVTN